MALLFSLLMVIGAMSIIYLVRWINANTANNVTVRNIETITLSPPPPPPPAMEQQPLEAPVITITQPGAGAQMKIALITPELAIDQKPLDTSVQVSKINWNQSLEIDWQAFDLNQLDGLPHLLSKVKFNIPKQIKRLGINSFDIALDVIIDEQGKVTLLNINTNPYPSFSAEITRFVKRSKFSIPTKNGSAVKARFIWTIAVGIK